MTKIENMVRFVPDVLKPTINPNVRALLTAWAEGDDDIVAQISAAKDQLFVQTALASFLNLLGSNVGVFRDPIFNLSDDTFRDLIPVLSYAPKQVKDTITQVLDIFFGVGNTICREINPNEIVIVIPSTIPGNKELRGSFHLTSYNGTVDSIDTVFNTITIDLGDTTQSLQVNELANSIFGQNQDSLTILSNTAGTTGVVLQFATTADLIVFTAGNEFNMVAVNYQGSFMADPNAAFTLRSLRGVLGQSITAGQSFSILQMTDASNIPDDVGSIIMNFGRTTEDGPVDYFSRPNNSALFIDPSYIFTSDHSSGEPVNLIEIPYVDPNIDGTDYPIYLANVTSSVVLAQSIIQSIVAAGVVVRVIFSD